MHAPFPLRRPSVCLSMLAEMTVGASRPRLLPELCSAGTRLRWQRHLRSGTVVALCGLSLCAPGVVIKTRGRSRDSSGQSKGGRSTARPPYRDSTHCLSLSTYNAPGGLRQDPGSAAESQAGATYGNGSCEMRVLFSTHGRVDVEPPGHDDHGQNAHQVRHAGPDPLRAMVVTSPSASYIPESSRSRERKNLDLRWRI